VVTLLAALGAPLAMPALLHLYKTKVAKTLERRGDTALARDLEKLHEWSRRERRASNEPYRIAYSLADRHDHIVAMAPLFDDTFFYEVGYTPAQQFRNFPMSDEPELLEALGVKYVVADHDYSDPVYIRQQSFGQLRVYGFARYRAWQPFTLVGAGHAELVSLQPERIQIRLSGTAPSTRLKLHVADYPRWQAKLDGRELPIDPATVYGMEYPILMEVPVTDGDLTFRYVRRAADGFGLSTTLLSVLLFGLVAIGGGQGLRRLGRYQAIAARAVKSGRKVAWAAGTVLALAGMVLVARTLFPSARRSERLLDGLALTDELRLGGARCEPQDARKWQCGERTLTRDVVGGSYGSHSCWAATTGPLVLSVRRALGRFVEVSYDPRPSNSGRVRVYADDELLGAAAARREDDGLTFLQVDTRARADRLGQLRVEVEGSPLHCFDVRLLH
jgi:hypothetical protein